MAAGAGDPINSFIDRTGLVKDKDDFLKILNDIEAKIEAVRGKKIELSVSTNGRETAAALGGLKKAQDETNKSVDEGQKLLAQLATIRARNNALNSEAAKSLADEKESLKSRNQELQNEAKLRKAAEGSINQLKARIKELQTAYDNLSKSQRTGQQGQDLKGQIDALQKEKAAAVDVAAYMAKVEAEKQKLANATERELKAQEKLNSAYNQLNQKYVTAAKVAKDLAASKGLDSAETQKAVKVAMDYHQQLLKIDSAVGQSQRNVGNYKSAFNGLTNAVNQITREVPNAAISMQTFFTAISNNLPILADEIGMVAARNKELADSGEKPVSVLAQLGKSVFSWQTALVAGVTILTLYGAKMIEWAGSLLTGAKSLETIQRESAAAKREIEDLSKALSDLSDDIKHMNELGSINVQIDETNIPKIAGLKKELEDIQAVYILQLKNIDAASSLVDSNKKALSKAQSEFIAQASSDAVDEYMNNNGKIDIKLKERDKLLYDNITAAQKALDDSNTALKKLNEQKEVLLADNRLKVAEIIRETGEEERQITLETARAVAETIKTKNADVLNNDRSTLRQRLAAIELMAAAEKRIAEAEKNAIINDPKNRYADGSLTADAIAAIKKAAATEYAIDVDKNRKLIQERESAYLRDLAAQKEYLDKEMQLSATTNKDISDNIELSLDQRLAANKKYFDEQRQLIEANYKYQLQQAGLTEKQIAAFQQDPTAKLTNVKKSPAELFSIVKQYESDVLKLAVDTNTQTTSILGQELKKQQGLRQENLEYIQSLYTRLNTTITTQYAQEVIALNDVFKAGGLSYEKYAKKRQEIDIKYQELVGKETVNGLVDQLKMFKDAEQEKEAALKKYNDLQQQYSEATTGDEQKRIAEELTNAKQEYDIAKDNVDKKIALENQLAKAQLEASDKVAAKIKRNDDERLNHLKRTAAQVIQIAQQLSDVVFGALNNSADAQTAKIRNQIDMLDKRTQKEIDAVEQSLDSQENKEKKEAEINARAAAQKDHFDQLQRQQDQKRAEFDKARAITQIILNTARAVVEALPNVALSAVIGAVGAAELAIAIAQPIPKYFKGKDASDNYEGLAVVGDGGKKEAIIRESGKVEITPATDTLAYVGRNDIILPDASMLYDLQAASAKRYTDKVLSYAEMIKVMDNSKQFESLERTTKNGLKQLGQIIKNNRPIIYQSSGSRDIIMGNGNRPNYYNKNLQG